MRQRLARLTERLRWWLTPRELRIANLNMHYARKTENDEEHTKLARVLAALDDLYRDMGVSLVDHRCWIEALLAVNKTNANRVKVLNAVHARRVAEHNARLEKRKQEIVAAKGAATEEPAGEAAPIESEGEAPTGLRAVEGGKA